MGERLYENDEDFAAEIHLGVDGIHWLPMTWFNQIAGPVNRDDFGEVILDFFDPLDELPVHLHRDLIRWQRSNEVSISSTTMGSTSTWNTHVLPNKRAKFHNSSREEMDSTKCENVNFLMDISDDLLHSVFLFLDHTSLCRAAMVCRRWRDASSHDLLWKCVSFENRKISIERFKEFCQKYTNVSEVNIFGTPFVGMLASIAVSFLKNLVTLTLGKGQLNESFFVSLADCSSLKSLYISKTALLSGTREIVIHHDELHHLELKRCWILRISIRCPQLQTLSLSHSGVTHAALSCPFLRILDMGHCYGLSDVALCSAATSCPRLESLDISKSIWASDETLREIALSCADLSILNAFSCPCISFELVTLWKLRVLKLHDCDRITSSSMYAISCCCLLEVVELDYCSSLSSVILDLPRLQTLSLWHCTKVSSVLLRTVMLSSLVLSGCSDVEVVKITSNSLQRFDMQKHEHLAKLELRCQCLTEVDIRDCELLTDLVSEAFSDSGCPMLKSLVLDNCEKLSALRLCNSSLVRLSLVGCRAITYLNVSCPCLEHVSLEGCVCLERASFCPVALRSIDLGIHPKLSEFRIESLYLVSLELKGCGMLSETYINCPSLTSFDASFCSQLKDDFLHQTAVTCPLIDTLILMSCVSISSCAFYSFHFLQYLTLLDLSHTFLMDLRMVFQSCLALKVLKLQACKYLADTAMEPLYKEGAVPLLQELDLSYGTLSQSALKELLSCSMHITHMSLNGCANMHDLNWGNYADPPKPDWPKLCCSSSSPSDVANQSSQKLDRLLQSLSCVACPNIRKVVVPMEARCFCLSSINFSLSSNLKEVDLTCVNLSFLNLSNCCSLETLKLVCPKLSSLLLLSTKVDEHVVEAAISECKILETLDVRFCPKICSMSLGRFRGACPSLKRVFCSPSMALECQ